MDETWIAAFMFLIFGWCCFFIQGDRDYTIRQQAVNNVTYRYVQVASKKGELSEVILDELEAKLSNYGNFEITLLAEKFEENNTITRLEGVDVVNYDLRENGFDTITIYVEGKKDHYLTKIFELSPMGKTDAKYKIIAQSSAYIQ